MNRIRNFVDWVAGWATPDISTRDLPEDHPKRETGYRSAYVNKTWDLCSTLERMSVLAVILLMMIGTFVVLMIFVAFYKTFPVFTTIVIFLVALLYFIAKKVN